MSSVIISGDTSGSVTFQAPAIAGSTVISLPANSMNMGNGGGNVSSNTAFGTQTLNLNTSGSLNDAFGYQALQSNTTGTQNVAVGYLSLNANTTGAYNIAIGTAALTSNTAGVANTAVGNAALGSNTVGVYNTAVGYQTLNTNTASSNTAVGFFALNKNTTGSPNDAFGYQALYNNTTGTQNVAIGYATLTATTTGSYNTAVGCQAGNTITTGIGNVCLGQNAQTNSATASSRIVIGANGIGQGDNYVSIGTGGTNYIYAAFNTSATWTKASDQRIKANITPVPIGLDFIDKLNVVKYNWLPSNEIPKDIVGYAEENTQDLTTTMYGMIAQEVKQAMDDLGYDDFTGWNVRESDGLQGLATDQFVLPLINAVKELKAELDAVKAELATLKGAA